MSKLAEQDFRFQEQCERLDQVVLKKIRNSMMWSMNTWGGDRCAGCGLKVPARCQTDFSTRLEDDGWLITGVLHAYGNACDSRLFFDKCPGENPD